MRIAINLIGYAPGCGGVETYLVNLLAALQKVDPVNQYLVLCDEVAAASLPLTAGNFSVRLYAHRQGSLRWILRGALQRIFGVDTLARDLNNLPVDVMHHPLTVLNPAGLSHPSVLTFHDMQHEYFPEFFSALELARRKSYLPSVLDAGRVIAISEHVAACLVQKYGVDAAKIDVVHSGCGAEFVPRDAAALVATAEKYGISSPFLFYPAAPWPHKNHLRLLEALRLLVERERFDGMLLLTGACHISDRELHEAVARLGLTAHVRWLGYLPKEDLPHLYNLARIMVFPSQFEGFGLPVLEAMASGCPVVCSNSTSLPEVGGNAPVYFDPLSADDIAEKLAQVWRDDALRQEMKGLGLAQAWKFSWEEAATRTLEAYRSAAGRGPNGASPPAAGRR